MDPLRETKLLMTRRHFFGRFGAGVGVAALASLLEESGLAQQTGLPGLPHFAAKAKRVIYLFQSGAPSQMDLFDYKPRLADMRGADLPDSVRRGQRPTGGRGDRERFRRPGDVCGPWPPPRGSREIGELMPHLSSVADDLC